MSNQNSAQKPSLDSNKHPDILLFSPVAGKPASFSSPMTNVNEIIETIRWVSREYQEFKPAIQNLLADINIIDYEDLKDLCDRYNRTTDFVKKMNKGTSIALKTSSKASPKLLKHIIQQTYNSAIKDPEKLNQYQPFSSEVYGETSFEFVAQLLADERTRPMKEDTFIDLGSGVGQVVLQVAASVECKKCYGIEKSSVPATYARDMEKIFKFWMDWHGKTYSEFELYQGNFFDERFLEIFKESTIIFVNNFAFEPSIDHKLKQKFDELKDGSKIISSKQFCPPNSRVTERNLADVGSIMEVIEILPEKKDAVSWTDKSVSYYLHILDRSRVEKYYSEKQKIKKKPKFITKKPKDIDDAVPKIPPKQTASIKIKISKKIVDKVNKKKRKRITVEQETPLEIEVRPEKVKKKRLTKEEKGIKPDVNNNNNDSIQNETNVADVANVPPVAKIKKPRQRSKKPPPTSLELLHSKTIESISCLNPKPGTGCIDCSFNSVSNINNDMPNIKLKDLSMFLDSKSLNGYLNNMKKNFETFKNSMKQPHFKENILEAIKRERAKKVQLIHAKEELTKNILLLKERVPRAMEQHCNNFGILNNHTALISHLSNLLANHQELTNRISQLDTSINLSYKFMNPPQAHSQNAQHVSSTFKSNYLSPVLPAFLVDMDASSMQSTLNLSTLDLSRKKV